jgi:hypothetical protein
VHELLNVRLALFRAKRINEKSLCVCRGFGIFGSAFSVHKANLPFTTTSLYVIKRRNVCAVNAEKFALRGFKKTGGCLRAFWCPGPESNRHALRWGILSR